MDTQKAVFLIVGVFVAGLVLGNIFSGGADTAGQAIKKLEGSGDDGGTLYCRCGSGGNIYVGCSKTGDSKIVQCPGVGLIRCESGWQCF